MLEKIKDSINSEIVSVAVIWVVTVLIAGFIAQFGKRFADYLAEKIKKSRSPENSSTQGKSASGISPARSGEEQVHINPEDRAKKKIEKKIAKALVKERKKKS